MENRGPTDRTDLDLWSWLFELSIQGELWSWSVHTQKVEVKGHSVQKLEWKQADGRTDGGDCITSHANAIGYQSRNLIVRHTGQTTVWSISHKQELQQLLGWPTLM